MIDKEIPSEYVSIRTIWLQGINDCRIAISQRAIQEPNEERTWREIGDRTVVYTVGALYNCLVDYGEATVRSDVDNYYNKTFESKIKEIWKSGKSVDKAWQEHAKASIFLFDFIIKTLNKYGMLFEKQPEGFSNVEMRSVE